MEGFLEEVILKRCHQGHVQLLTEKGRVYQAEGTAKAKARRQENVSLLNIPRVEATMGIWRGAV